MKDINERHVVGAAIVNARVSLSEQPVIAMPIKKILSGLQGI